MRQPQASFPPIKIHAHVLHIELRYANTETKCTNVDLIINVGVYHLFQKNISIDILPLCLYRIGKQDLKRQKIGAEPI